MNKTLAGAGVIITRPAGQCENLAALVEQAGGRALVLPAMAIEATPSAATWPAGLDSIDRYQLVIFISRNAVRLGAHFLKGRQVPVAAVGPSTARALGETGMAATIVSPGGFTSEELLAHPELQDLQEQRVLIIRGEGGRELLAQTLAERGARVDYLEVYRRVDPVISKAELDTACRQLAAGEIRFVTATSVQTLENLVRLLGPDALQLLGRAQLVSASERVLQKAKELGLPTIDPAPGPADQDLMQHMLKFS